jgi:hypothetical protein
MPNPLAICLEDLDATSTAGRYLRCVALVGRQPGLRLGPQGSVGWRSDEPVGCELWVSGDDRLILYRPEAAPAVRVSRAGRSLDVPAGKPVVLLGDDVIEVGGRRIRVHVHGAAPVVAAPSPLPERASAATRMAAVVAMGAAVAGCEGKQPAPQQPTGPTTTTTTTTIEVRAEPPAVSPHPEPPPTVTSPGGPTFATPPPPASSAPPPPPPPTAKGKVPLAPPIEVRHNPPDMAEPEPHGTP